MDVEEILKRGFVNVPEKYIYVEQNLSKKISVLENAWKYEGCGTYADDNRRNTAENKQIIDITDFNVLAF